MKLPALDWIIILVYLAVSLLVGFYFSKRALRSVDDYFVSGRVLPWWLAGMSMIASAFAIDTPLGITGLVAKDGIPGVWYTWSFALGGAGGLRIRRLRLECAPSVEIGNPNFLYPPLQQRTISFYLSRSKGIFALFSVTLGARRHI